MRLIDKLLDQLSEHNKEHHAEVSDIIKAILRALKWNSPLMIKLFSHDNVEDFLYTTLDKKNPSALQYGCDIFNNMLKALNVADIEGHTTHDPYGPLDQLPVVVKIILSKMPDFRQYLDKSPEKSYRAQNSQQITPFGWRRYNILNLINSLLNLKYAAVISELSKANIFPMIVDLLFKFEHNSFCHSLVFKLASSMLDQFDPDVVEDFLQKTDLPKKILEAEKKFKSGSKITIRKEYMPFLYKLAIQVSQLFENITDFKKIHQRQRIRMGYPRDYFS